eukprot:GHVN01015975.1.p1 GENE.GHVN01015975.1~~GHVN01015975.1.p1  ORF type:complete len:390 (-),score=40.83 GHVN01015975.1:110-1216(-)
MSLRDDYGIEPIPDYCCLWRWLCKRGDTSVFEYGEKNIDGDQLNEWDCCFWQCLLCMFCCLCPYRLCNWFYPTDCCYPIMQERFCLFWVDWRNRRVREALKPRPPPPAYSSIPYEEAPASKGYNSFDIDLLRHPIFQMDSFAVKQNYPLCCFTNSLDIVHPTSRVLLMTAREEWWGRCLPCFKHLHCDIRFSSPGVPDAPLVIVARQLPSFCYTTVEVDDEDGNSIGIFKEQYCKFLKGDCKFDILDENEDKIFTLTGNMFGYDFEVRNLAGACVCKIYRHLGGYTQDFILGNSHYGVSINEKYIPRGDPRRRLLITAAIIVGKMTSPKSVSWLNPFNWLAFLSCCFNAPLTSMMDSGLEDDWVYGDV